jgi:hypothetical protein
LWEHKAVHLNGMKLTTSCEYICYGSILNPSCRFFDKRIGQSTTLTGRAIARHMDSFVNECITGKYDHTGDAIVYGDTDSVAAESIVRTSVGDMSIEQLFHAGSYFWKEGDKEYSVNKDIEIAHIPSNLHNYTESTWTKYNYVYRHKVKKKRFKIKTANGKEVIVTEDHSVMVLVDGKLIEKKPAELSAGDLVISLLQ